MPTRMTEWMYYKRGGRLKYDDNNQPGYARKSDAEHDEAAFKRTHLSVITRIYTLEGVVNGKKVNWYNIIYKNRLTVKAIHQVRWNIRLEIEDVKTKKKIVDGEQILAKNKTEVEDYIRKTKWAQDKRYKIIKATIYKEKGY